MLDLDLDLDLDSFATEFPFASWETIMAQSAPTATPPPPPPPPNSSNSPSGSDGSDPTRSPLPPTDSNSGADGPDRFLEDRRVRRKISNRDSARRSRMRKQRHLENLRAQAERLRASNRDLATRLGNVAKHCLLFHRDNARLRHEHSSLARRLSTVRHVLALQHLQRLTAAATSAGPSPVFHGNELDVMGGGVGLMSTMGKEQTLIT